MTNIIELQYATMLSNRLEHFKIKKRNPTQINFRCPLCGDSQKNKNKTRGWLLENRTSGTFSFYCHNCFRSLSFSNFLKEIDNNLYNSFIADKYVKTEKPIIDEDFKKTEPIKIRSHILKDLKKISQLKSDHPVKKYIESRQIPSNQHYRFFYAPKFVFWINSILPDKLKMKEHPRLVFPFIDKDGKCFGVSARSFDPEGLRYITIMFEEHPKIFGLDVVDMNKTYYICEGPIDSLFLDNSVAMAGADGNINGFDNIDNAVYIFDNEPRNTEIHKRMEKIIRQGHKICIWPSYIKEKDINDMFLSNIKNVKEIVNKHTFSGLEATLKLSEWRKT